MNEALLYPLADVLCMTLINGVVVSGKNKVKVTESPITMSPEVLSSSMCDNKTTAVLLVMLKGDLGIVVANHSTTKTLHAGLLNFEKMPVAKAKTAIKEAALEDVFAKLGAAVVYRASRDLTKSNWTAQ